MLAALLLLTSPADAAVTIAFWSRDFGNYFPHAFFTLRGTPDAGGPTIDASYGFTARSITPKLLFGNVGGRVEAAKRSYMTGSHARFSVTLSDAQYARVLDLIRAWDEKTGNSTYNLGKRNCVHFVREAAMIAGLSADFPKLMKKPGRYLQAVAVANPRQVAVIDRNGKEYLAGLPPIDGTAPVAVSTGTPGLMKGNGADAVSADAGDAR
ncbi:hypothetical protein ASG29_10145 [Sphingomonas sp. Leaf412]|uniref:hypothetical protein n=1 Tax=Sphingomonas sp. Leaf412 TaxID=1736370 RepID=UPI0006FA0363|nr:hypothetical protein [Sphingomonas sp. Leaf412]KQT32188.1 hypothetical protein ASG29_10145 [Sphingomonas sp. Leaf412]